MRVHGDDLDGFADELLEDLQPRLVRAAERGAEIIAGAMRRIVSRRASDAVVLGPGAPPVYRSGELYRSIKTRPAKVRRSLVEAAYGSDLEQAAVLEWGGNVDGDYHAPHPYFRPAEDETREAVERAIEEELGL